MAKEHGLEFPLLQDPGMSLAKEMGLVFTFPEDLAAVYAQFGIKLPEINGVAEWQLPMPARYLVDGSGLIRDSAINPDYTRRPEPKDMVELLAMLA